MPRSNAGTSLAKGEVHEFEAVRRNKAQNSARGESKPREAVVHRLKVRCIASRPAISPDEGIAPAAAN